jgi:hypothetical protein
VSTLEGAETRTHGAPPIGMVLRPLLAIVNAAGLFRLFKKGWDTVDLMRKSVKSLTILRCSEASSSQASPVSVQNSTIWLTTRSSFGRQVLAPHYLPTSFMQFSSLVAGRPFADHSDKRVDCAAEIILAWRQYRRLS